MTRLGEMLRKEKIITGKQLREVLESQKKNHKRLGKILVSSGYTDKEVILGLLDQQQNSPYWEMFKETGSVEAYLKIKKIRL
ncbi:hypothetical protein KAI68_07065 [bacterium]|nr:hypothetical protein [bacterium]